jgi:hypothetical protein
VVREPAGREPADESAEDLRRGEEPEPRGVDGHGLVHEEDVEGEDGHRDAEEQPRTDEPCEGAVAAHDVREQPQEEARREPGRRFLAVGVHRLLHEEERHEVEEEDRARDGDEEPDRAGAEGGW